MDSKPDIKTYEYFKAIDRTPLSSLSVNDPYWRALFDDIRSGSRVPTPSSIPDRGSADGAKTQPGAIGMIMIAKEAEARSRKTARLKAIRLAQKAEDATGITLAKCPSRGKIGVTCNAYGRANLDQVSPPENRI